MITDPTRVSDLRIWLLASLYFALNALTQGWVSPTADLDQAQQLVLSQNWNLGYGTQPPLYTWLVNILFAITGPSLWVLLALKSLLLSLLAAGILAIGRELGFDGKRQLMALAGLALIPQVIWEAQRDLTHSLLATLVASWTLWSLLRLWRTPDWRHHLMFGLLAGLGLLSKYNFAVFLLALALAVLFTPAFRRQLLGPGLALSALAALGLVLPHLLWVLGHAGQALASSHKLALQQSFSLAGPVAVILAVLAFLGPLLVAAVLSGWPTVRSAPLKPPEPKEEAPTRLLWRLALAVLIILLLFVMITGASHVKDRWLQPLLFFVPLLIAQLSLARPRWLLGLGSAAALVAALLLPGRTLMAAWTGKLSRPNLPYAELGADLRRVIGQPDVLIAGRELLAGNLRLAFPTTPVVVIRSGHELGAYLNRHAGKTILVVTDDQGKPDKNADPWALFALTFAGEPPELLEHPMRYVPNLRHVLYWRVANQTN